MHIKITTAAIAILLAKTVSAQEVIQVHKEWRQSVRNPQPMSTACLPPSATEARISCAFFTSAPPFPFPVSTK